MDLVVLFHNPEAGNSTHPAAELVVRVEESGFACHCVSLKDPAWESFDVSAKVLLVAGGDGSIRAVIGSLIRRVPEGRPPTIGIIPLGTANNISRTFAIPRDPERAIDLLRESTARSLDVGRVEGLSQTDFFVEGMGIGVFPALIRKMDKIGNPDGPVDERLAIALEMLADIAQTFEPLSLGIKADGVVYDGDYLLVEVMNTRSIGPNLVLAGNADPGDGILDLVLIPAAHRMKLLRHVRAMQNGRPDDFTYLQISAREIILSVPATWMHVDDEILKCEEGELNIQVAEGVLNILTPLKRDR
ncbi:diacylglycerol kinase family lipid kinase [Ravibacter arvi]|uniref:Diacylglycerol kinase family lipid kinase n=1 Tax=Ravibacter arvi TaxID=2051041 RepID=A0ABP8LZZ1_9BACT